MPESDKRNLIAAQLLHQHGKKMMTDQRFEDAIKILTDAKKLFLQVSPALLKIVDNYGDNKNFLVCCFLFLTEVLRKRTCMFG
jgi:hypothetical protein